MSIEYVRAVQELDNPTGLLRYLLLTIAEHANSYGIANPGNECLASETKISERHIRRMIPQLQTAGLIEIIQIGNGRGHRRTIRLLFPPAPLSKRGTNGTEKGAIKGDYLTPFMVAEEAERGTNERERGTNDTEKGDTLPEKTGDNPNYNPTTTAGGVDLGREIAAPLAEPAEAKPAPPFRPSASKPITAKAPTRLVNQTVLIQSPYLRDPRKFRGGYILPGQGSNPVEAYYESFSINQERERLSAPQEDDLAKHCTDLEHLRSVLQAYRRQGNYAPKNLNLIFDWYSSGIPKRIQTAKEQSNGQYSSSRSSATANRSTRPQTTAPHRDRPSLAEIELTARLINGEISEDEYNQQSATLCAASLPDMPRSQVHPAS